MIINTAGIKIDMTAVADQFGISTPVSLNMDKINVPDNLITVPLAILSAGVIFIIAGTKFLKGR